MPKVNGTRTPFTVELNEGTGGENTNEHFKLFTFLPQEGFKWRLSNNCFSQITKTKGKPKQTNSHREQTIFRSAEAPLTELQPRVIFIAKL